MLKVALLAAAFLVAASTAAVEGAVPELASGSAPATPCIAGPSPVLACATRAADANGDGTFSAVELANLAAAPAPGADLTSLHPAQDSGLDFKDASTEPASVLRASLDDERSHPLVPAVFALGALMVLLRRRPNRTGL